MEIRNLISRTLLTLSLLLTLSATAKPLAAKTEANVMVELTFTSAATYADPFNDITLDAIFNDPQGRELRVPAFWAGTNIWKIRYASPLLGTHPFRTECSDKTNKGLHGITGKIEIKPYTGENPLYLHGPLRVSENHRFMEHADGTPFFWLADTWWMGLCHRMKWPDDFQKLAADRKEKGFNVIQIVAGLYPDMHPFDPRGANETGYPWETNYSRIRPEYFNAADQRLLYLADQGFTPCIFGAWGHYVTSMGVEKAKQHWRYLIARYGALPVVWSAAGEANLPWYQVKGFPYDDRKQAKDWSDVMRYIRDADPFHRLLTVHPTGLKRLSARHVVDDPGLLDFDMLQTPHGKRDAVVETLTNLRQSYTDGPTLPVIDGEASYEMLETPTGIIPTEWTRRMFWLCMMSGTAGHSYGANGIWQVNRNGQPHGPSPTAGSPANGYGAISWEEAMKLPGSQQVGFGKQLFEKYPWQNFRPHPEWASYARRALLKLDGCQWIWFPEGEPAKTAPVAKRYFRRAFSIPKDLAVTTAQLRISADDQFVARLNGEVIGASPRSEKDNWKIGKQFDEFANRLKPGINVLAIEAENLPSDKPELGNPAGLIVRAKIDFADTTTLELITDATWNCSTNEAAGWDTAAFDDTAWPKAASIGKYGDNPWARIDLPGNDDAFGPQSAGTPGVVRVIYVPENDPIVVNNLGRGAEYIASYFDPVKGTTSAPTTIRADDSGQWKSAAPTGYDHDWVLVLENPKIDQTKLKQNSAVTNSLTLQNDHLAWHFDWTKGRLQTLSFDNKLSGHPFPISDDQELNLVFSAALDQPAQPYNQVSDFEVRAARRLSPQHVAFDLRSPALNLPVTLHFELDGAARRKWVEMKNESNKELLLLDVELDNFKTAGIATGGGEGQPVYIEDEFFAAIEHPAGVNSGDKARLRLAHYPGKRLAAGETYRSHTAVIGVAAAGKAQPSFVSYLQEKCVRPKKAISVFTPFGINNLWGGCPALDDEETMHVLDRLQEWQKKGMRFDYFTLDTGWVDPTSDLTRFRPSCYPNGPQKIVERVKDLNMKFGLWFATSWGAQSAWDYPPAFGGPSPGLPWREGYPITREGINFCVGTKQYHEMLKNAVLYHMRSNNVRLLKFDGGDYVCNVPGHGHLLDKYSVEARFANIVDIANAAHAAAPDVYIMWYWGFRSPFWALYGDMIFESGLHMEGSGTSSTPTLYYRDSVNLALDQNTQYARNIPPIAKDSLGVWLAEDRWGNYMGKQRWREAMVADLGRGNLFVPNLWGNIYLFDDKDLEFLQRITALAKKHEDLLLHRRNILGNPFLNQVYGYAYTRDSQGLLFVNNNHFTARRATLRLDSSLGFNAKPGTTLHIASHFPDQKKLLRADGSNYKFGDTLEVWLRPFEYLMLEVSPSSRGIASLTPRDISPQQAAILGTTLTLKTNALDKAMDIRFADAARFEGQKFTKRVHAFETKLPSLEGDQPILAVTVRLRNAGNEWRYKPTVVQIVQALARVGDENVQLHPVPDSRQYGNTQAEGCSWVTFKVRLNPKWSGQTLKLAIHAYLPDGVVPEIESWVVKRWWEEDTRPSSNGYYTDEPS